MSTETLGWVLAVGPLAVIWIICFMVDPYAGFLITLASIAAGLAAATMMYGLMLAGVLT